MECTTGFFSGRAGSIETLSFSDFTPERLKNNNVTAIKQVLALKVIRYSYCKSIEKFNNLDNWFLKLALQI
jgi:hypothetical protein